MRVLNVNKFYYRRGGAETVFFSQADVLREHGHEVIPFAMEHPSNLPSPYARYFVSNVELREEGGGIGDRLATAGRILWSREAAAKIDALVTETRPDIAHLHNVYHQLSPSIIRALHKRGVPVVLSMHDYKLVCPAYTLYANGAICERCKGGRFYNATLQGCVKDSRFKSALCTAEAYLHGALGAYKRYVKFYIAPSRFLGAKVVELGLDPRRVVYVPNCVEPPPVPASEPEGRYFLYAGRLERVKGLQTLLEAVAGSAVARGHELWIAGEGDIRTDLEAFCAAQNLSGVRFLGHLTPADLEPVLQNARFAVVPSEWYENMPLSVLEAAGRGKAVIVSDMGGLPETVVPEETGIVFRAGAVQELRAAIERMLLEPERTREMGRKARAFIQETYSPERHYAGIMGVYGRVLGTNAADGGLTEGVA